MSLSREQIKQIIVDEILRALRELGVDAPAPEPAPAAFAYGPGVVVLSGLEPIDDTLSTATFALAGSGVPIEGLLSLTFRQAQAARGPLAFPGVKAIANPDDEPGAERAIERARWVLVPDVSLNTLNKAILGIEDSVPTRAIAAAFRHGRMLLFSEKDPCEGDSRLRDHRAGLLRKLEARGAVLAQHRTLPDNLRDALDPPELRPYAPPPPPKPTPARIIITFDDVFDAMRAGRTEVVVPEGAIITAEALDQAARLGLAVRRAE